jgi:WD40 repeat protein
MAALFALIWLFISLASAAEPAIAWISAGHSEPPAFDISPDGSTLASVDTRAALRLWQIPAGRVQRVNPVLGRKVLWLGSSGKLGVLDADHYNTLNIIRRDDGTLVRPLVLPSSIRDFCRVKADQVIAIGTTNSVAFYDFSADEYLGFRTEPQEVLTSFIVSEDGLKLVTGWESGKVIRYLIDSTDRREVAAAGSLPITAVRYSRDAKLFAALTIDGSIKIWKSDDLSLLKEFKVPDVDSAALEFSSDNSFICISASSEIRFFGVTDGVLAKRLAGHSKRVLFLRFSPDRNFLYSASDDLTLKQWNLQDGSVVTLTDQNAGVYAIAFSPDSATIATGSHDGSVHLRNSRDGVLRKSFQEDSWVSQSLAFSPNGENLAVGKGDSSIRIYDLGTGVRSKVLTGHSNVVQSLAFSPGGDLLASGSRDHTVKLWQYPGGTLARTLIGHSDWVKSVVFSPNGEFVASAENATIRLWRSADGTTFKTLDNLEAQVWSLAYSPDGTLLAAAMNDGAVKVWENDGILVTNLPSAGFYLAFGPEGKTLLTSGTSTKLWSTKTWRTLLEFSQSSGTQSLAYSPNGQYFGYGQEALSAVAYSPHLDFENFSFANGKLLLKWSTFGGPYQLQQKTGDPDASWINFGSPTSDTTATIDILAGIRWFRLQNLSF